MKKERFVISVPDAAIDDLRERLARTRFPRDFGNSKWEYGTNTAYLKELVEHWRWKYDWRRHEREINSFANYKTEIEGIPIHFIHEPGKGPKPMPLILSHGWPWTFWDFHKVIRPLTDPAAFGGDPADAFDVVVPDMPGYGYSDRPAGPPLDSIAVAGLWAELMEVLGFARFGAAGGDIGSHVSRYLGLDYPGRVVAVHRMDAGLPVFTGDPADLTPEERAWLGRAAAWGAAEGAYGAMHRTKPQTAAVGLTDSPAGLAAWITEKLRAWSDCGGEIEQSFTKDEILTNVTIYWLTGTIGSSMRMYHANAAIPPGQLARRVEVPSGFALFPGDIGRPPRAWLERVANVVRVSEPARGGHFAPFEEPELYAQELRAFFRPYRSVTGHHQIPAI